MMNAFSPVLFHLMMLLLLLRSSGHAHHNFLWYIR
jgi:hypothetical protein